MQRELQITENDIRIGNIEGVERILQDAVETGKSVKEIVNTTYGKNQNSPLQIACTEGYFDLVCLLLQNGADINHTDSQYNWTALHCAAQHHIELCDILLKYGADIHITSVRGTSAFHYVCKQLTDEKHQPIQLKVLDEMLRQGQDINLTTKSGETALHHACLDGNVFTTQYLLEHNADINIVNKYGENALHYACRRGVEKIVSLLLEAGANPNAEGGLETPLEIAEHGQQQQIVELLNLYMQGDIIHSDDEEDTNEIISVEENIHPETPRKRLARQKTVISISSGRLNVPPEGRRFGHIQAVLIRNMEISGDSCFANCYFTVHENEVAHEELYRSDIVYHTRQPTWHLLDIPKDIYCLKSFHIRVWRINESQGACLFSKKVRLQRYSFIGTQITSVPLHVKSVMLLELKDGYYVSDNSAIHFTVIKDTALPSQLKPSYSRAQLQSIIKINQKIATAQVERQKVKGEIADILPSYLKHQAKQTKRDQIRKRIDELQRSIRQKEKQIEENKRIAAANYQSIECRLREISTAMTGVMADTKILEQNHRKLLEKHEKTDELEHRCNLKRAIFVKRLKTVFPITQNKTSYAIACLCIGHAPLPNNSDFFGSFEDPHVSTALGFVSHVVHLLSTWYDIPLRYPLELCGSHSSIMDPISVELQNPKFPLYMGRGVDKTRLEYGLYLLNVNIQQILNSQGLEVVSLRNTLSNLSILMVELTKGLK